MAVTRSYNCGVVGYHVRRIAEASFLALGFVNAPASIAPVGGTVPGAPFGTNPIALAVPRAEGGPLVLDQSSSVVAKSEIVVHRQRGEAIPLGWALDLATGQPTTDPAAALDGGTYGAGRRPQGRRPRLPGSDHGRLDDRREPVGGRLLLRRQCGRPAADRPVFFLAVAPGPIAGEAAEARLARLLAVIADQPGARLPGTRRAAARARTLAEGVVISGSPARARLLVYATTSTG